MIERKQTHRTSVIKSEMDSKNTVNRAKASG